ncbi:50S ribosomal protein L3 N(5)-glutamine methyltransferase [Larsenimonas suaedae]|uniref:Ribosomal protein uL3 glutamine methyltransferase n=1 Tax=Larsenimonas suaedae TaxID=1851019 RepID=A0ABU1GYS2_9GAMM|nr:50S ribosomal protein L3 N(5)-glutamine methyltransferase [Larsenimonas suaedae]MCM2971446.1 50S ribosomal protein L3 N(5)-glutamine methyltransferase [Larsenimonas suaedae]MDR5896702.1 50S ribosomal protein L3 N(5)-glutamine methyltransferase [Larsenimonas suaedae]
MCPPATFVSAPVNPLTSTDDALIDELSTLRDYIRFAVSRFQAERLYFGHGTESAWDEAVALVLGALHLPHDIDPNVIDARLTRPEALRVMALIRARVETRTPLPYLLGEAYFAGIPFEVSPAVLIPRSPIAELIQQGFAPWFTVEPPARVLDLCTGSGCIGLAAALMLSTTEVVLSDISPDALDVARRNTERHELLDRVEVIESDLFDGLGDERFDLIVSNPPYVDARDLAAMPSEFGHEPTLALAAGDDGLSIVHRILKEAGAHLTDHGVLIVEVGNSAVHLDAAYPDLPVMWLEFEHGGEGVFAITAETLKAYWAETAPSA